MSFKFNSGHVKDYHERGFTVFRDIVPPRLLSHLRREADKGRSIARRLSGPCAQRLQPIAEHAEIDMAPFRELALLPELVKAVNGIFETHYGHAVDTTADLDRLGILYEPEDRPSCMRWHRDFRDLHAGIDVGKWQEKMHDIRYFNQTNVALYSESCLWVVPGSHLRLDTEDEIRRFPGRPVEPPPGANNSHMESVEYEHRHYVQSMPGAEQVQLNAGDYLLYRNTLWHTGCYIPYQKRATVHGTILTREYDEFLEKGFLAVLKTTDASRRWRNPNIERDGLAVYRCLSNIRRFKERCGRLGRRYGLFS